MSVSEERRRQRSNRPPERRLVGVDQLADRRQLPPQLVVDAHLAVDLVASMEDGRVISSTQLRSDTQQGHIRLLAHQEHGDLAGHDDGLVALLDRKSTRLNSSHANISY